MKNNQRIFGIAFLFALLPLFAGAQGQWGRPQPGLKGKLEGALVDSLSGQPVEFATVVVLKAGTQEQVDGTITDEKGRFKLFVEVGTYDVQLSFLGYQTKVLRNLRLTKRKPDLDLKRIFFTPESLSLEEVTVSAEASTVENRVDKIVYHADKDATNAGGDAADVLRKVPLLSVDLDGNVSLRGSSNLRILINGKPSSMFATSVADALKTIPADQIKSVEVITTPSAKYDGEGSGGIINIITKKKSVEGFTGSVNSSLGTRNNSLSLNLAAAKGRFGLNANGSGFFFLPNDGTWNYNRFDTLGDGQIRHLQQSGTNTASRQGFHGSIGAFYDINAYNSINSSFRINGFNFPREGANNALLDDPARQIVENSLRQSEDDMLIYGFDWTNDYTKKFADQPERELVFAVQLSGNINDRSGSLLQSGNFPYLAIDERYDNDGTNLETTFQLDYTHPFSKKVKLEIGAKSVLRDLESQYRFDTLSAEQRYAIDQSRSDVFNYNQNVYAGYASFNIKVGDNYGLVAGARYERTDIRGEYNSELPAFQNDYANLLPSIILSRTFKNYSSLKLSYNQRIQRPSLFYINPFTQQSDRNNLQEGNPQLQPEVTHQLELGYNTFVKGVVLSGALYFRHTDDIIESI
ncbi:MAG: TonB-dependent receptor, partial [Bacteroidetes bacterium]